MAVAGGIPEGTKYLGGDLMADQQDESQEWMTLSRFHTEVADRIEDLGLHGAHVACTA